MSQAAHERAAGGLLVVTRRPGRFAEWIRCLEEAGLPASVSPPDSRAIGGLLVESRPGVVLLDLADAALGAEECRSLVARFHPGHAVGVVAVAPEEGLHALVDTQFDDALSVGARPSEVLYRVRRLTEQVSRSQATIELGELTLRPAECQVTVDGRTVRLRQQEFKLLYFLASRPNRVFRREELAREVWGSEFDGSLRTVDTHICRLRTRLGERLGNCLQTVRGVGYRLATGEMARDVAAPAPLARAS
jgi:DNA-binding response OmpR family regulator